MIKSRGRECDKVIRSLVSGFPNEVDFALNVLTVMSFEKPESIPITKVMLYMYRYMHVQVHTCTCVLAGVDDSSRYNAKVYHARNV